MKTHYIIPSPNYTGKICYKAGSWPLADGSDATKDNTDITTALEDAELNGVGVLSSASYSGTQLGTSTSIITFSVSRTLRAAVAADGGGHEGTVTIGDARADYHAVITQLGWTLTGLSFLQPTGANASIYAQASGLIVDDCNFNLTTGSSANSYGILFNKISAGTVNTINRCKFDGVFKHCSLSNGNLVPTFNYCRYRGGNGWVNNYAATFNNIVVEGNSVAFMTTSGNSGAVVTWNNPIFAPGTLGATTYVLDNTYDQVWTINTGLALGNWYAQDGYNFRGVTINSSIRNKTPGFVKPKYPAVIVFGVDDRGLDAQTDRGVFYFSDLTAKLDRYGWKGTFGYNAPHSISAAQLVVLVDCYARGHTMSNHTRDHSDMTATTSFTIAKAGKSASLADGILTTTDGNYTLASYTLLGLRTQLAADGFTVGTLVSTQNTVPATVLADFTNTTITSAKALDLDVTRYRVAEVDDAKTLMVAQGFAATTFSCPGNVTDASLRTYLSTRYAGARGDGNSQTLASMNVFGLNVITAADVIGVTTAGEAAGASRDECIRRNMAALLSKMNQAGNVYVLYAHTTADLSLDDWDAILDVTSKSNVQVMSLEAAISYVKTYDPSSDLACADELTYTRTLIDGSDPRLSSASPCLGAGTLIPGLTQDYYGVPVPAPVPIGISPTPNIGISDARPGGAIGGGRRTRIKHIGGGYCPIGV